MPIVLLAGHSQGIERSGWPVHCIYNQRVDHHTVAAISIAGTCFDVLSSLYLAYDLLRGQHGPLRLLTRAVTYSVVFGIGYGLGLGLFFGLASGIATGVTTSAELNRAARSLDHYSLFWEGMFAAIRGIAFGVGLYRVLGFGFAASFGLPHYDSMKVPWTPVQRMPDELHERAVLPRSPNAPEITIYGSVLLGKSKGLWRRTCVTCR